MLREKSVDVVEFEAVSGGEECFTGKGFDAVEEVVMVSQSHSSQQVGEELRREEETILQSDLAPMTRGF